MITSETNFRKGLLDPTVPAPEVPRTLMVVRQTKGSTYTEITLLLALQMRLNTHFR